MTIPSASVDAAPGRTGGALPPEPRRDSSPRSNHLLGLRLLAGGLRTGMVLPVIVLIIIFSSIDSSFLIRANLVTIAVAVSYPGIVAVGQTLLISAGEFDLSVGAAAGLSAYVAARAMVHFDVSVGILVGLGIGAGLGLVNAILVVGLRVPSFISTIGMLYVDQGLTGFFSRGRPVYPLPASFSQVGLDTPLGLSWAFIAFIVLVALGEIVLRYTVFGRRLLAIGGNAEAAALSGIRVRRVKVSAFVIVGVLAGAAGLLQATALESGDPSIGSGWELLVIAAVIIGGTNLFGGYGTVLGTLLGIFLLQIVDNGLISVNVPIYWQELAVGLIMIIALTLNLLRTRLGIRIAAALGRSEQSL